MKIFVELVLLKVVGYF